MADKDTQLPSVDDTQDPLAPPEGDHPYWQDLNPDFLKGENHGMQGPHPENDGANSAANLKAVSDSLSDFTNDDLKQIPVMPPGSRLEQGATYLDLHASPPREFTAMGDMEATKHTWYVPKKNVPYPIWNRLTGVENPERLDERG